MKKKEIEGRPTKDLELDESKLQLDERTHYEIPWKGILIFGGIIIALIIICIVVICATGGPIVDA